MKIAVIGARGFLGQALTAKLAQEGVIVHAISRNWDGFDRQSLPSSVRYIEADAAVCDELQVGLRECAAIYHLAYDGVPLVDGRDHLREYRLNLNMLNACIASSEHAGVQRFVYVSSGGTVYGEAGSAPILEAADLNPVSHYGNIKRLSESLLLSYCSMTRGVKPVIARVANPFGSGQIIAKRKGLVVSAMLGIARNEPVSIYDGGTQIRDYLHVDDVVTALILLGKAPSAVGQIFNISSGFGRSVLNIIEDIELVTGRNAVRVMEKGRRQDVASNVLCNEKLRRLTGWTQKFEHEQALRSVWQAVLKEF